jgi:hypothetical protein
MVLAEMWRSGCVRMKAECTRIQPYKYVVNRLKDSKKEGSRGNWKCDEVMEEN